MSYFIKITKASSLYHELETKEVGEILREINHEDQKVALAVEQVLPNIQQLVEEILPRMQVGGRVFYIGAGTSGRLGVLDTSEIPPTFGMPPHSLSG